ncbi:MAG: D-tyrosyl-tRNA(Tyr) deacylase [Clostridia bacterium]|nr:D-tyrosyl-tRNA(Tyr) deacylase [Clostridia bacterium]
MKAVIQRVTSASVSVNGKPVSSIGRGFLILLGAEKGDGEAEAKALSKKIAGLRVFRDPDGKMNLSAADVGGEMLVISNFTLCADCSHGNRPSFFGAEAPELAEPLYDLFCLDLSSYGYRVGKGIFGADMAVSIENEGPVTIVIDSDDLKKGRA